MRKHGRAGGCAAKCAVTPRRSSSEPPNNFPSVSTDSAVAAHVNPTDGAIGALAIEQPGTGNVLALAQSRPMGNRTSHSNTSIANASIAGANGGI